MWYEIYPGGTWDEWDEWERETKAQHPVQYFFRRTVRHWFHSKWFGLSQLWWVLMHHVHPKHRYHVIKPRSLKPGYHELDTQIRAAAFDILSVHAETLMGDGIKGTSWKESDFPETDDEGLSVLLEQIDREAEIIELRNWWVDHRPRRNVEDIVGKPKEPEGAPFMWVIMEKYRDSEELKAYREWAQAAEKIENIFITEDEEKFIELIKLLPHLWS